MCIVIFKNKRQKTFELKWLSLLI